MASSAFTGPLRRKKFRRLVTAQFVAELGDGITLVALPLYVYARTESELLTSLTFAIELGLGIILALVGGVFADTFNRQRVLLVSYVVRSTLLTLAFLVDPLFLAISLGVSARALGQGDNPSFDALIPGMAEGDLQEVVALRRLIQAVSMTLGPAVGAMAVYLIGPRSSLALNAATFVLAFCVLITVRGLDGDYEQRKASRHGMAFGDAARDLFSGMAVVTRTPGVRRMVYYNILTMATVGLLMASAVVFYERDLDAADYWYGLAIGAFGIGNAVGLGVAGSRSLTMPLPRIALIGAPIYAVCCAIGGAITEPWVLALSWFLWGIALGPEFVRSETFFVSRIVRAQHGRAFAGLGVAATLGMTLGFAVSGPLLEAYEARWVILSTGVFTLGLGIFWIGPAREGDAWPGTDPVD